MWFRGACVLLLIPTLRAETRSLFDDLVPSTTEDRSRYVAVTTTRQGPCPGENSATCGGHSGIENFPGNIEPPSLFGDTTKISLPIQTGRTNNNAQTPSSQLQLVKYVPDPYPNTNDSSSLFDKYIGSAVVPSPAPSTQFASSYKSSPQGPSLKLFASRSRSILDKEKEAMENLADTVWKQALQSSGTEKESSKDVLDFLALSAKKLKTFIDNDDAIQSPSTKIDRKDFHFDSKRTLTNEDLKALAHLLQGNNNKEVFSESPKEKSSFIPFIDEIKQNRIRDLSLALKIMKTIESSRDLMYADQKGNENFEQDLAQLLFSVRSLKELTRQQRDSLDFLMKRMDNLSQEENRSDEDDFFISQQLFDLADNDFSLRDYRPPDRERPSGYTLKPPVKPPGLYELPERPGPASTPSPPVGPPSPPIRPPSPPVPGPPSPPEPGPPAPPIPTTRRPVGPPSFSGLQNLPLESDESDSQFFSPTLTQGQASFSRLQDDIIFLAPVEGSDDSGSSYNRLNTAQSATASRDNIWTPVNSLDTSSYGDSTDTRDPPSATDSGAVSSHNYHYHYHTLNINQQQQRDANIERSTPRRASFAFDKRVRNRIPSRPAFTPQRDRPLSSYSSLESFDQVPPVAAAPPFIPSQTYRDPPQAAPPDTYSPPAADPVSYRPPPADPPSYRPPPAAPPVYGPPPADPSRGYGPPPADPPRMTYGPPPRDPPAPPRTQTRVVFLSPVPKFKGKGKFSKKNKGRFNAFSVLFDDGPEPQFTSFRQSDPGGYGFSDDFMHRRHALRDEYWRSRDRLHLQQQEAFEIERLRTEIELQERQRGRLKKGLFSKMLSDEGRGGGVRSMFYKGAMAIGAMSLLPLSTIFGRKKRDLADHYSASETDLDYTEQYVRASLTSARKKFT